MKQINCQINLHIRGSVCCITIKILDRTKNIFYNIIIALFVLMTFAETLLKYVHLFFHPLALIKFCLFLPFVLRLCCLALSAGLFLSLFLYLYFNHTSRRGTLNENAANGKSASLISS